MLALLVVLILSLLVPSPGHAQAVWSDFLKIHIDGYSSVSQQPQHHIRITATSAELAQTLKTQRLQSPSLDISGTKIRITASAKHALMRETEILLTGAVQIKFTDTSRPGNFSELRSDKDIVALDLSAQLIRGSGIEFSQNGKRMIGHGFKIDLSQRTLLWISEVRQIPSSKRLTTPLLINLF